MNYVFLIGRLTKDIQVKTTNAGKAMCKFTLAINNGKDKNGNEIQADYPQITVFGPQAETCARFVGKGSLVSVVGEVKTSTSQGADGTTNFYTNIHAKRVEFLEFKEKKGAPAAAQPGMLAAQGQQYPQGMPAPAVAQPGMPAAQGYPQGIPPQGMPAPAQYPQGMPAPAPQQQYQTTMQPQMPGVPQGFTPADEDFAFDPSQL